MAYKTAKIIFFSFLVMTLGAVLVPFSQFAHAQTSKTYTLLEPLPCIPDETVTCKDAVTEGGVSWLKTLSQNNMGEFFQYAFNLLVAVAGVAAVFMMVWGGFLYTTSVSQQNKTKGLEYFQNAIYGLLMILCAYLVLRTVNPRLVSFPKSIPAIKPIAYSLDIGDFFSSINNYADQYKLDIEVANKARDVAKANIVTEQKKIGSLQEQYTKALETGDEAKITQIKIEMAAAEDRIIQEKQNYSTQLVKSVGYKTLEVTFTNPGGDDFAPTLKRDSFGASPELQDEEITKAINAVETYYQKNVAALKKEGITEIPATMTSERNFAKTMLEVVRVSDGEGDPAIIQTQIKYLNSLKTNTVPKIVDPKEKINLTKTIDAAINAKQTYYNIQTGKGNTDLEHAINSN